MILSLYSIKVMIVLFLLLSITLPMLQTQGLYSNILRKYFQGDSQPHFFVSVGLIEELTEAMQNQFRNWQSLYALEDKSNAVHPYLASEKVAMIYALTKNETQQVLLQINLAQLCTKYYLKTLKILIISAREDLLPLLKSNFWSNELCLPEAIFLQSNDERIKNYLRGVGYTNQGRSEDLLEFTRNTQVENTLQIEEVRHIRPSFISIDKLLEICQRYIGKKNIFVRSMSDSYLLAENIIDSLPNQGQSAHIFVTNFIIETDSVIIGHFYELELVDFDGSYFQKIEVYNDRGGMAILYLYLNEKQHAYIRIIGPQDQILCKLNFPKKDNNVENRIYKPLLDKPVELVQEDDKLEPSKQENTVQLPNIPQENSIFTWLITILLILIFSIALRSFLTKARPPTIISHHYNTIQTHQISIIEDQEQPFPK